jgi:hypothetical protein
MQLCNFTHGTGEKLKCNSPALPFSLYCTNHHELVLTESSQVQKENASIAPQVDNSPALPITAIENTGGKIRSLRLEIGDSVRLDGSEIAANIAAMMPTLSRDKRLEIALAASRMMEAEFKVSPFSGAPSLEELLAIELFFDTCLQVTRSLVGVKKTKLNIKAKDDMIQGAQVEKARQRKVAVNKSLEKIQVSTGPKSKAFAHTALDMVRDIFFVSEALDSDASKLMKKLCDRILTGSALDEISRESIVALFEKDLFKPLKKFVTFK